MKNLQNYKSLKRFSESLGADLFGVADISKIKNDFLIGQDALKGVDKAVCIGARLSSGVLSEIKDAPTRLYFHHYRTINAFLDQASVKIANYIQRKKFTAIPIPASQIIDWELQKGHLSHKKIGVLAGLGWIGRSNLLVNKKLGSQFRLATILTNMPLKTDKPVKDDCAQCRLCISICPAGAIKERKEDFEHLQCFAKLKEFQTQKLVDQYICGVCVNICKGHPSTQS